MSLLERKLRRNPSVSTQIAVPGQPGLCMLLARFAAAVDLACT
jgi:hypothetical protein